MTRVVSLFLPRWSTDRLRRKSDVGSLDDTAPLVLVGHDSRRRVIMALDDNAEALGLRLGMPVAKAQALAPDLRLMDANPAADAAGLQKLAHWALQRISPIVMADPPDGLVIDTTGADHLHGGEAAMLGAILQRFASSGVKARIALAQSWGQPMQPPALVNTALRSYQTTKPHLFWRRCRLQRCVCKRHDRRIAPVGF